MRRSVRTLADPATARVSWPEYEERRAEYVALEGKLAETDGELRRHADARAAAEAADRGAYAAAIRDGNPDPGPAHFAAWEAKHHELRRRSDALAEALTRVEAELAATLAEHEPGYRAAVRRAEEAARKRYAAAVEAMVELREPYLAAIEVGLTLDAILAGHSGKATTARRHRLLGLAQPNGEPYAFGAVVAALRADASPPDAEPAALTLRRVTELRP
jgi:hypothetical protein